MNARATFLSLMAAFGWLTLAGVAPAQEDRSAATATAEAPSASGTAAGTDQPIEVQADQALEWHRDEKAYVARGNAVATRGDVSVRADTLTAYYRERPDGGTEIYRLSAEGNVVIAAPEQKAFGDRGVYDVDQEVAVLTGDDLRLTTPQDVVTARDSLEYWRTRNLAVARGDAVATRGDSRVRADRLVGLLENNAKGNLEMTRIDAEGGVVITTPKDVARGNQGTYDVAKRVAVLTGDVKITRGKNQLNGTAAEVDLETGISRILSGSGKDKGRVRGLFVPGQEAGAGAAPPKGNAP